MFQLKTATGSLTTFGAFHDRHQIVGFGNVRGHGRMDVVGDSTAEPQVRRLLFGDGKHVHGNGRAGDQVECVVNGMLGIVKHRTVACHFDAFAVGEGFGFRMGGHDVRHVHRETPDADAAQHGQMAAEAEFEPRSRPSARM